MIGWRFFWVLYFLYRCVCSVAGQLVVVRFTTLGDSVRYQGNAEKFGGSPGLGWLLDSTQVTEALGVLFAKVTSGNEIAINVLFQSIAFYGIYRFLNAIPANLRKFAALLVLAPSFNLWSSVASKDALVVFAAGVSCSYLIELYRNSARLRLIHPLAAAVLAVFKPHYLVSLLFIYSLTWASRFVRQYEALLLFVSIVSVSQLYIFRDRLDDLSFQVVVHFITDAGFSTREAFWQQQYDVFWRAPYGMLLSFVGPTFEEALRNPLQMVSLVESLFLLLLIVVYLVVQLPRMPAFSFLMSTFAGFWLLFANYPFGVMNPGSAIRYRTGYYLIFLTILLVMSSRKLFDQWRSGEASIERKQRRSRFRPRLVIKPSLRFVWPSSGRPT